MAKKQAPKDKSKTFLTPDQLSDRWEGVISVQTLANWRSNNTGPKPFKAGGKVLYSLDAVLAFEESRHK